MFAERGFRGVSVEDICDRADFTRGAFYSNFASKDELVLALFQATTERLLEQIITAGGLRLSVPPEQFVRLVIVVHEGARPEPARARPGPSRLS